MSHSADQAEIPLPTSVQSHSSCKDQNEIFRCNQNINHEINLLSNGHSADSSDSSNCTKPNSKLQLINTLCAPFYDSK